MVELDMKFVLGNLCIDISLWSKIENKFVKTYAIFDTGAHTTHVDTDALKNLGYDLDDADKGYISTVGSGKMQINNIVIDNVKMGKTEIGSVLVNFSDLSDIGSPVILGLNVIKEFKITLDFENMKMLMEPNFDINSIIHTDRFTKHNSRFGMWVIKGD